MHSLSAPLREPFRALEGRGDGGALLLAADVAAGSPTLLKRASALKPQDASITDSLGWAQYVTGNVTAAVPVLERAAAGAPDDPTVNEHLGDALWSAGRRYEARYAWNAAAIFAEGDVAERLAAKAREGLKPEYAAP